MTMRLDRPPKRPAIVEGPDTAMDVCLSICEYRECLEQEPAEAEQARPLSAQESLTGAYVLEPWVEIHQGLWKWSIAAGVDARREDDGA